MQSVLDATAGLGDQVVQTIIMNDDDDKSISPTFSSTDMPCN